MMSLTLTIMALSQVLYTATSMSIGSNHVSTCTQDGTYYMTPFTILQCTNGNPYVKSCPSGTVSSGPDSPALCDINLGDTKTAAAKIRQAKGPDGIQSLATFMQKAMESALGTQSQNVYQQSGTGTQNGYQQSGLGTQNGYQQSQNGYQQSGQGTLNGYQNAAPTTSPSSQYDNLEIPDFPAFDDEEEQSVKRGGPVLRELFTDTHRGYQQTSYSSSPKTSSGYASSQLSYNTDPHQTSYGNQQGHQTSYGNQQGHQTSYGSQQGHVEKAQLTLALPHAYRQQSYNQQPHRIQTGGIGVPSGPALAAASLAAGAAAGHIIQSGPPQHPIPFQLSYSNSPGHITQQGTSYGTQSHAQTSYAQPSYGNQQYQQTPVNIHQGLGYGQQQGIGFNHQAGGHQSSGYQSGQQLPPSVVGFRSILPPGSPPVNPGDLQGLVAAAQIRALLAH